MNLRSTGEEAGRPVLEQATSSRGFCGFLKREACVIFVAPRTTLSDALRGVLLAALVMLALLGPSQPPA